MNESSNVPRFTNVKLFSDLFFIHFDLITVRATTKLGDLVLSTLNFFFNRNIYIFFYNEFIYNVHVISEALPAKSAEKTVLVHRGGFHFGCRFPRFTRKPG